MSSSSAEVKNLKSLQLFAEAENCNKMFHKKGRTLFRVQSSMYSSKLSQFNGSLLVKTLSLGIMSCAAKSAKMRLSKCTYYTYIEREREVMEKKKKKRIIKRVYRQQECSFSMLV